MSVLLCAAIAFAIAVPAFAADGRSAPTFQDFGVANQFYSKQYCRLNVYIGDYKNIANGTNVTVYKFDHIGNPTLVWTHTLLSTGYYTMQPNASALINKNFVLNINTNTNNCNLWQLNQLPREDYSIRFDGDDYYIKKVVLAYRNLALTVSSEQMAAGGNNVIWQTSQGTGTSPTSNPQYWDFFLEWD